MTTELSTLAPTVSQQDNARLFQDLFDEGLIEPREFARAARRLRDEALGDKSEALAALVCKGVVSRKRFAALGVRAHAERRLLRGQERLQIVQQARELVEQRDRERLESQAARGRPAMAWLGDMVLGLFVVLVFLM